MPQKTNLNVSPYFDDFRSGINYNKVLFKPSYPVQARELTTLQSILQNQIEILGNHTFKEGSVVVPGNIKYQNNLNAVILEDSYNGVSPEAYLPYLITKQIKGEISGVTATINSYISSSFSEINKTTLYVSYLNSDSNTNSQSKFLDGEKLVMNEDVIINSESENSAISLRIGEGIGITISENCNAIGSGVFIENGIYFIRGYFVEVYRDILYLEQYSNTPTYKVGFKIFESIINSYDDSSLNDNAQGFSNYAAPGADRFKIFVQLTKIPINSSNEENFIPLLEVRNGSLVNIVNTPEYNILSQEFARRTYDESGDYFVKSPTIEAKESLNNLKGNNGIFLENQLTYNNNIPSEKLGTYKISPLKAYIRGYEVETQGTFLDFEKPRTTKTLDDQSINYFTGPTFTLNRVYGSPIIGLSTSYSISLRDSRVGTSQTIAPGKEIGLARVYDFALESGSYNTSNPNQNQWDISLFDIQTYTEIQLNEPITLTVPMQVKGSQSGAVAYLRNNVTNSRDLVVYSSRGRFSIGEKLSFNGIENTRITTNLRSYGTSDVKSLYGIVGSAYTFTADTIQSTFLSIGQVTITPVSSGISTVTSSNISFVGIASTSNLVAFSSPGITTTTYAKIESVSTNALTISGITSVAGICDGALPASTINPSDFRLLITNLQSSVDNNLYTKLPKSNISSVDLTKSQLTIRKQFDITITSNSTGAINTDSGDETFLPFDEERYVLIRRDGSTEPLSSDKFVFTNGSKTLTINGLGSNGSAKLIATIRKINIKSKIKNKNRIKTIIVDKSKYSASGIGSTTLNDGLTYGNYPYGTRVQDEEICLMEADATKLYGIFESNSTSNPNLPSLSLTNLNGPTNKVGDLLIGEEFVGKTSQAIGIYAEKINDLQLSFTYLNSNSFVDGEELMFKESGITGYISLVNFGDKNITSLFSLDSNQQSTIYDYSKIIRKKTAKEPTKKLKIVFESAGFSSSDTGDLITINSYQQFDYCDINKNSQVSNSDILDIRPKVSSTTVSEGQYSPFEFLGRNFAFSDNAYTNVLASDESILLSYAFYLPRIDKILLSKDGVFQLNSGIPSETPQEPISTNDSLDIATVILPPYLCKIDDIKITPIKHKRYQMYDISILEDRIKNLEYYTSLSLLETDTSNLLITDANGLNRFKSGFFVDDFSSTTTQQRVASIKNSIDPENLDLRPSHFTTSVDLLLGTNSLVGIGTSVNSLADASTDTNLIGDGLKRTGQLITLNYEEESYISQPFATKTVNVNPYITNYFIGSIDIFPSSDTWVDQTPAKPKIIPVEGNYKETEEQLESIGYDPQTGYAPILWNSWNIDVVGEDNKKNNISPTIGANGTIEATGNTIELKKDFDVSPGRKKVIESSVSPYVRSRNIEFTGKLLKPFTRVYSFFDGIDINKFIVPKLLEIEMESGVFQVGETVECSFDSFKTITLKFRVAKQNHKYGSYDNPSTTFTINPYLQNNTLIGSDYSSTSTILNVDTYSLSNMYQGEFYGYISSSPKPKLLGKTSNATAYITNIRLITDNLGEIIGSFYIPDGKIDVNPTFNVGTNIFKITSSSSNSQNSGDIITSAEENYYTDGKIETTQRNIIVTRNAKIEVVGVTTSIPFELNRPQTPSPNPNPNPPPVTPPPPPQPKVYQGFAGGIDQNAGGSQSQQFGCGTCAVLGPGALERALADGYSMASIQNWVYATNAIVGSDVQGIQPSPNECYCPGAG